MSIGDTEKRFRSGEIIMRQGEKGDAAYLIESGQVQIILEKPGGIEQEVGTRGPGTIVGEMAIIDDAPRTATVRAIEDCSVIRISREEFSLRLKNADPIVQMITQVILTRYRDTLARSEILRASSTYPTPEDIEKGYASKTQAMETIKMANDFKLALERGELYLHYQPIVSLSTGRVNGFEALMRWQHPERGFISPGVFIPVAEDSGLIVEASRWALAEACGALRRIEDRLGEDETLYMSVNFSSSDFAEEDFLECLYTTLSRNDVPASQICLEITERILMQQPESARETLSLCRSAGLGIAIDDFGTGYSSLSYLHAFPISTLKVDQSFVRDLIDNPRSRELVKAVVGLGKNLNMKTVAEGVESAEEAEILREMGCDMAQGYFFAKPVSEKDVTEMLLNWDTK